ncbi:LLM class F420-dependent oxidoreductase [Nocardioides sp. JQ2195]|uniref:LLM class F420-dependent oxidoreductase n=1 Tax=Nocardioides sp. JQ2195 TaxID=2592334 RepID=UPI00143E75A8|nr:LLM class F420-dependent oxidoreductase [Nocardioides sp. JQ2195]QIX25539.1 LLM class F420-dependent oxidoreductase [Nocardioides sp. JQ2195]
MAETTGIVNATLGLWQDRPANEAFETAAIADRLGFSELWIGEMATFDAFSLATAIGLRTQRITPAVGPFAVSVRTPVNIAVGAATVTSAIGRRVNVALGTSSNVVVEEWHGLPRKRPAQQLEEATQIVARLLRGEKVSFDGETLHTKGYRLRLPAPGSSVSVAAFGPRAIRFAGAHADRVLLNMVTVDSARRLCEQVAQAAAEAGRERPRIALWLATSVDPTPDDLSQMVTSKTGYLAAPGYSEMFVAAGFESLVEFARTRPHPKELRAAMPEAEIAAATCLAGGLDDVRTRIGAYLDAGVDEVCVVPTTAGDPAGLRTLGAIAGIRDEFVRQPLDATTNANHANS